MSHPVAIRGYTPYVVRRPDGTELLISVFRDVDTLAIESVTVAERPEPWATWGPPLEAEER